MYKGKDLNLTKELKRKSCYCLNKTKSPVKERSVSQILFFSKQPYWHFHDRGDPRKHYEVAESAFKLRYANRSSHRNYICDARLSSKYWKNKNMSKTN